MALLTPFEVAFLPEPSSALEPFFIVNRIVDAVFMVDLVLQFFVMYSVSSDQVGTSWVADHDKIIHHYLTGVCRPQAYNP